MREDTLTKDASDPRGAIANALAAYLTEEQVNRLVDEVLALHKRVPVRLHCENCGHAKGSFVEIPDAKAVVSALTDLLSQGFGRAGEAKVDDSAIVFKRLTAPEEVTSGGTKSARKRRAPRKAVGKSSGER